MINTHMKSQRAGEHAQNLENFKAGKITEKEKWT